MTFWKSLLYFCLYSYDYLILSHWQISKPSFKRGLALSTAGRCLLAGRRVCCKWWRGDNYQFWWASVPGYGFLCPPLNGEVPLVPDSGNLSRAKLSTLLFSHSREVAVSITGRTGRSSVGREMREQCSPGGISACTGHSVHQAHVYGVWGTKPGND